MKFLKFLKRALLTLVAVFAVLVILINVILIAGVNFLNTGGARDLALRKVNEALAASGYKIMASALYYDPVRGFTVENLAVSDKGGRILDLDSLSLDVAFSKIPLRTLDLDVEGGALTVYRLPPSSPSTEETPKDPLAPFQVPDIFFTRIVLDDFSFSNIDLREGVAGSPILFAPRLAANIGLGDDLSFDIEFHPDGKILPASVPGPQIADATETETRADAPPEAETVPVPPPSLPEDILLKGTFAPSRLSLDLDALKILSRDYAVVADGSANLSKGGTLDIALGASFPDLTSLTRGEFASARLSLGAKGESERPILVANGVARTGALKDRGLGDIVLQSRAEKIADGIENLLSMTTTYKDRPISIEAVLSYAAPVLTVRSFTAAAPSLSLDASGTYSLDTGLADAKAALDASDLSVYRDIVGGDLSGALKADVTATASGTAQSLSVTANANALRYDSIRLSSAKIDAAIADVSVPFPQKADATLSGLVLSPSMSVTKAALTVTEREGSPGTYQLSLDGNGLLPKPFSLTGKASASNVTAPVPTVEGLSLDLRLGKSLATLRGGLNPDAVDLKFSAKEFRPADIPASLPHALRRLRLSADIAMTGPPSKPMTNAAIDVRGLGAGRYEGLALDLDATHDGAKADVALKGTGPGINTLSANASVPLSFSLLPFSYGFDTGAALAGKFTADLDVKRIAGIFLPATQEFSGDLDTSGTLGGTVASPAFDGRLSLSGGSFNDDLNGIELRQIAARASFDQTALTLSSFGATDGETGRMDGRGAVAFATGKSTTLSLRAQNFHLPKSEMVDNRFNAALSLKDLPDGYGVAGKIDILETNVAIPESFTTKIPQLNIIDPNAETEPVKTVALDIDINAPNRIFVRGWGLDAEFGGKIDITGDAAAPLFDGELSVRRGRYEEFGKRFTLSRANLRFQGAIPPSPYLDIEATTPAEDVTASILLTGPVGQPEITFSSVPALPDDEVLSRILFGRDTTTITPFQAVQLAQTLQRFSGNGGGFDPLAELRGATGLDDISVETDEDGETNVGVGKYLTDDVYVEVERGKAENSGAANIQIEISPSVNVESRIGQDAQTGGGVFWKRDY